MDRHDQQLPVGCNEDTPRHSTHLRHRCSPRAQQCVRRNHIPPQHWSWLHQVRIMSLIHVQALSFVLGSFAEQMALACCRWSCRDPVLVSNIGSATALEVRATGISYTFAPCVAVCRDPRWGRCYESYSEDPGVVTSMTTIIDGLQGQSPPGWKGPYLQNGSVKYRILLAAS